jgi:hypothetical protein
MSTSQKQPRKFLGVIARKDAEALLLDWANLPDEQEDAIRRLMRRHGKTLGPLKLEHQEKVFGFKFQMFDLFRMRDYLRKAWDAKDRRTREWHIFQMRSFFSVLTRMRSDEAKRFDNPNEEWLEEAPPITELEAVAFYFQTVIADRAKRCAGLECPAPYFIAKKRWQKYCSEECAGPAMREQKKQWWRDNRAKNGGLQ